MNLLDKFGLSQIIYLLALLALIGLVVVGNANAGIKLSDGGAHTQEELLNLYDYWNEKLIEDYASGKHTEAHINKLRDRVNEIREKMSSSPVEDMAYLQEMLRHWQYRHDQDPTAANKIEIDHFVSRIASLIAMQRKNASNIQKADKLRLVSEKIEKHILQPSKHKIPEERLKELRLEGIGIIGDDRGILSMWESVFNLLKSEVTLGAGFQLGYIDARIRAGSSPVGSMVHGGSYPVRRE